MKRQFSSQMASNFCCSAMSVLILICFCCAYDPEEVLIPGKFTLSSILPVRQFGVGSARECAALDPWYTLETETIIWAVEQSNKRFSQLGYNITIGTHIRDSCDKGVIGLQESMQFFETQGANGGICQSMENNVASCWLGEKRPLIYACTAVVSAVSKRIAPIAEKYCMPVIGTYATSPELNSNEYPNFLRTVPDDTHQSRGIADLLQYQNLSFISIVYEHSSYGDYLDTSLIQNIANNTEICIEQNIGITLENPNWNTVMDKLWDGKARVIVILMDFTSVWHFFAHVHQRMSNSEKPDFHRFLWIGTDAWSRRVPSDFTKYEDMIDGAICMEPAMVFDKDLDAHLENLHYLAVNGSHNPWIKHLFEQQHNCSLNVSDPLDSRFCNRDLKLKVTDYLGREHFTLEAVYAFAYGVEALLNETCSRSRIQCKDIDLSNVTGTMLFNAMRKAHFTVGLKEFKFNGYQGPPDYSIFQYQKESNKWQEVGSYSEINFTRFNLNSKKIQPPNNKEKLAESIQACIKQCKDDERRVYGSDTGCCYICDKCNSSEIVFVQDGAEVCQECPLFQIPDHKTHRCIPSGPLYGSYTAAWIILFFLSLVGTTAVTIVFAAFVHHSGTPLMQFQQLVPSTLLLPFIIHVLLFFLPIMNLFQPSEAMCLGYWISMGLLFTAESGLVIAICLRLSSLRGMSPSEHPRHNQSRSSNVSFKQHFYTTIGYISRNVSKAPGWITQLGSVVSVEFLELVIIIFILCFVTKGNVIIQRQALTGRNYMMCNELHHILSCMPLPLLLLMATAGYLFIKTKRSFRKGNSKDVRRHALWVSGVSILSQFILLLAFTLPTELFQWKIFCLTLASITCSFAPFFFYLPAFYLLSWHPYSNNWTYLMIRMGSIDLCRDNVIEEELLGSGHFGAVFKAKLHLEPGQLGNKYETDEVVVVKKNIRGSVSRTSFSAAKFQQIEEFHYESEIMRMIHHKNILSLVGICHEERWLVLQYMNCGSAEKFLRRSDVRESKTFGPSALHQMLMEAVRAVKYLHKEGIIHRDIAARNLFVEHIGQHTHNIRVVLGDFGLAKNLNTTSKGMKNKQELPLIWTAPESFRDEFIKKSDIWAMGVLMYEVFSWGADPLRQCHCDLAMCEYGRRMANEEIERKIYDQKLVLTDFRPFPCRAKFSPRLQIIMQCCWSHVPSERPSAKQLFEELKTYKDEVVKHQPCYSNSAADLYEEPVRLSVIPELELETTVRHLEKAY